MRIEEKGKCDASPNPESKAEVLLHSLETLLADFSAQSASEKSLEESETTEHFFVPDYLKLNAYRVLRLPAKSNYSEIHNASASMKRAARLGVVRITELMSPTWANLLALKLIFRRYRSNKRSIAASSRPTFLVLSDP